MKYIICYLILILSVISTYSQTDYNSFEVGGNYINQRIDDSVGFSNSANGFEVSAVKNFHRYFGAKFSVSGTYKNTDFSVPAILPPNTRKFSVDSSVYNYLGGVQIKDNNKDKKVKPFAHFLIGGGTIKQTLRGDCPPDDVRIPCSANNFSRTGFAMAIGGGVDLKVSDRISIRAIQTDYNPIRLNGQNSNNFRIGAGIVFHQK